MLKQISQKKLDAAKNLIRVYNHPLRQSILKLLDQKETYNVTSIYVDLRIEQSVASQQLGILRKAGLVKVERDGKEMNYSVNHEQMDKLSAFVDHAYEIIPSEKEEGSEVLK